MSSINKNITLVILLLYFIFTINFSLKAQPGNNDILSFNYVLSSAQEDKSVSELLKIISANTGKDIDDIEITFTFNEFLKVEKKTANNIQAVGVIKCTSVSGDNIYKGFDLSNHLFPAQINYQAQLNGIKSKTISNTVNKSISISYEANNEIEIPFKDSVNGLNKSDDLTADIKARRFIYASNASANLSSAIELIDSYYKTDQIIKDISGTLDIINSDSVLKLAYYNSLLNEAEKKSKALTEKKFTSLLPLHDFDPENYLIKHTALNEKIFALRQDVNKAFSNLDFAYTSKGQQYLKDGNEKEAVLNFKKALDYNPLYAPAQIELARINLRNGNLNEAADSIIKVYQLMTPDAPTIVKLKDLSDLLNATFLSKANEFIIKEDFNSAIILTEQGVTFCSAIPGMECSKELQKLLIRSKTGLYLSYLKIARKALTNDRLEMTATYLQMAGEYKITNHDYITEFQEAEAIREALINAHTQKGMRFLTAGNYKKSLDHFDLAKGLSLATDELSAENKLLTGIKQAKHGIYKEIILRASSTLKKGDIENAEIQINEAISFQQMNSEYITTSLGTDSIFSNIKHKKYEALISSGRQFLGYGQFGIALESLSQAKEMEKAWTFKRNKSLDSMLSSAAKPLILEQLATAQIKAWGNDLPEAENYYKKSYLMQQKYGLGNDEDLNKAINNINDRIYYRECQNAQELHNKYYSQAIKSINNGDYILTGEYLDRAIGVSIDYPNCNISIINASEKKSEFLPAINYQTLVESAKDAYNVGDYKKAVISYRTSYYYYNDFRVYNMGITHLSFSDFMILNDKPEFLIYCAEYFAKNSMFTETMEAFNILRNKKIKDKRIKGIQKESGISMGIYDRENKTGSSAGVLLLKYTGNDKYFSTFRKYYRKGWRKAGPFLNFK